MTDHKRTAQLIFPDVEKTTEYYEELYPPRELPEGARVTRFSPSPTGYLHFGGLYASYASKLTAERSGGLFMLRIEDTDKKREVEGGVDCIINGLAAFGVAPDEGVTGEGTEKGNYGPYTQSLRREIYRAFAKKLVEEGRAYPCFCTPEELEDIRNRQENEDIKGYYGKYAKCRDLSDEEIEEKIKNGTPFTVRLRSEGDILRKIRFDDMIKGKIEMSENVNDIVILKTDGIPTYHFAHAVDDHLMRTTHVVRGDEWIASVPLHLELFRALGFKPVKYAHFAPIMKEENGGKRKISKRKDPEANVTFYIEKGYPEESVREYILTILNSDFEDWRRANKTEDISKFPFNLKKMSLSGALFDIVKFNDVSKNAISVMSAQKVYELVEKWAQDYDKELYELFTADSEKAKAILNIDRENPKPRKDIACWSEVRDYVTYFYNELYTPEFTLPYRMDKQSVAEILGKYKDMYSDSDSKDEWFAKIKELCEQCGYAPNVKEYKQNPDAFKGHVGDVSSVIRVAVTSRVNTPDLYYIMQILGKGEVIRRIDSVIDSIKG
ncbi:MAG: glutamate--tRNA ligase [Oscillospiraceae bacterium]|nr:glutamate--tRNA ligase [Oscillospiraceae bacterium]